MLLFVGSNSDNIFFYKIFFQISNVSYRGKKHDLYAFELFEVSIERIIRTRGDVLRNFQYLTGYFSFLMKLTNGNPSICTYYPSDKGR